MVAAEMTRAPKESMRNPAGSVRGIVRSGIASSAGNVIVNFGTVGVGTDRGTPVRTREFCPH